ncbi:MAG: hypothetical protein R3D59_07825 [Paracoccaceae bacterium]
MTQTCPPAPSIAEADAFSPPHPEVEAIDIVLHDPNGNARQDHHPPPLFAAFTGPAYTCRSRSSG